MARSGRAHSLSEVWDWNCEAKVLTTAKGKPAARTPVYHALYALQHFGPLKKVAGGYEADPSHWAYNALLAGDIVEQGRLSPRGRRIYADLILLNSDCNQVFLKLTGVTDVQCALDCFLAFACPVVWRRQDEADGTYAVVHGCHGEMAYKEDTAAHISVMHGLRYWLRDEVRIMDEYFHLVDGITLYPCSPEPMPSTNELIDSLLSLVGDHEWTTLSVRDDLARFAVDRRWPLSWLFAAIKGILSRAPGYATAVNVSPGFLTLGTKGHWQREFELRTYPQDSAGRLITHVKLNRGVKRVFNSQA